VSAGWALYVGEAQPLPYKYVLLSFELIEQPFPNSNICQLLIAAHFQPFNYIAS
jgi:hypothetical protein